MKRELICIECPLGCHLTAEVDNGKVISVVGNKCPKGVKYAFTEIEAPVRVLTSTVLAKGLGLRMVPVKTDGPIPKVDLFKAMEEIKRIRIKKPVKIGEIIRKGFILPDVNLIATRDCS